MKITESRELADFLPRTGKNAHLLETYRVLEASMASDIHPLVTKYANLKDNLYLTDHGPRHIADVIRSAKRILLGSSGLLNDYELYILLIAINFHDVGNMFGRIGHEEKILEVTNKFFAPLSFDQLDITLATQVASKHGGKKDGSKNRLRELDRTTTWKNEEVRPQLLAAILKLADEISENSGRADNSALMAGLLKGHEAEIHHVFSASVNSLVPDFGGGGVKYKFYLREADLRQKYSLGKGNTALIEYIYERTIKTYFECIYCSKYSRGFFHLDNVSSRIEVYTSGSAEKLLELNFRIEGDNEYPGENSSGRHLDLIRFEGALKRPSTAQVVKMLRKV